MSTPSKTRLSRREFLRVSATGTAVTLGVGCRRRTTAAKPGAGAAQPTAAHRYFPTLEFATLSAACERILPADADPGARALAVPEYFDRMFSGPDRPVWHLIVRRGITRLDREARRRFERPFSEAPAADQDRLLAEFQSRRGKDRIFFGHLLAATLEGAFCDPSLGGNRAEGGWNLVGFVRDPCGLPPMPTPPP